MDYINEIKEETLIICNSYVKSNIIKMNKLLPIKFMNLYEFIRKYFFSYDEDAILFVMNKYNVKYEIAKEYIESLYYIDDDEYNNSKLVFLVNLKKELIDNELLKFDLEFKKYVSRVKIIIWGVYLNRFLKKKIKNYTIINDKCNDYIHDVFEFETMEDEIHYVANNIASLVDSGIPINNIKLLNVDESYYTTISRIFSLYNLKVDIKYKRSLASYPIIKEFINEYKNTDKSIYDILDEIDNDNLIYDKLIDVINDYLRYDNKELIIYKLENTYITSSSYTNAIDIVNYLEYVPNDNEYYFLIGFNEGIIPKYHMDTDYLSDYVKEILDIETSSELNIELKKYILKYIKNIKNLVISYKLKDSKGSYYPSQLVSNFKVIKKEFDYSVSYSKTYNKMLLTCEYDNYYKFGYKSNIFDVLNSNYKINYNSFDNRYTKIDRVMNGLYLSYSKMQLYNKCAFRYYLTDILKLDIFCENFATVIGNMVHYVMEKCLSNSDYDTEKYVKEFLVGKELSKKEMFFLDKYKKEIKSLLDQVLLEREYSLLDKALYEKKIDIEYDNNIHFVGIIDKILYTEKDNNTYLALVDYKTGNDDINLNYLKYGLNMQLPIYLYLSSKLEFNNPLYTGFYLQKFNINDKDYRLVGYSNSDKDILTILDNNYDNSKIIKGLKTLKDGSFAKSSKVLSNEEINNIKDIALERIDDVIDNIKNNNFDINPKVDNDKNIGCEYCKFYDICFKTKEDEVSINVSSIGDDTI